MLCLFASYCHSLCQNCAKAPKLTLCHNKKQKFLFLFCSLLTYSYLCTMIFNY